MRKPTLGDVAGCATNAEECDILRAHRLFHKKKYGESPRLCVPVVCEATKLLLSCQ